MKHNNSSPSERRSNSMRRRDEQGNRHQANPAATFTNRSRVQAINHSFPISQNQSTNAGQASQVDGIQQPSHSLTTGSLKASSKTLQRKPNSRQNSPTPPTQSEVSGAGLISFDSHLVGTHGPGPFDVSQGAGKEASTGPKRDNSQRQKMLQLKHSKNNRALQGAMQGNSSRAQQVQVYSPELHSSQNTKPPPSDEAQHMQPPVFVSSATSHQSIQKRFYPAQALGENSITSATASQQNGASYLRISQQRILREGSIDSVKKGTGAGDTSVLSRGGKGKQINAAPGGKKSLGVVKQANLKDGAMIGGAGAEGLSFSSLNDSGLAGTNQPRLVKKVAMKHTSSQGAQQTGVLTSVRQSSVTHRQGLLLQSGPHTRSKSSAIGGALDTSIPLANQSKARKSNSRGRATPSSRLQQPNPSHQQNAAGVRRTKKHSIEQIQKSSISITSPKDNNNFNLDISDAHLVRGAHKATDLNTSLPLTLQQHQKSTSGPSKQTTHLQQNAVGSSGLGTKTSATPSGPTYQHTRKQSTTRHRSNSKKRGSINTSIRRQISCSPGAVRHSSVTSVPQGAGGPGGQQLTAVSSSKANGMKSGLGRGSTSVAIQQLQAHSQQQPWLISSNLDPIAPKQPQLASLAASAFSQQHNSHMGGLPSRVNQNNSSQLIESGHSLSHQSHQRSKAIGNSILHSNVSQDAVQSSAVSEQKTNGHLPRGSTAHGASTMSEQLVIAVSAAFNNSSGLESHQQSQVPPHQGHRLTPLVQNSNQSHHRSVASNNRQSNERKNRSMLYEASSVNAPSSTAPAPEIKAFPSQKSVKNQQSSDFQVTNPASHLVGVDLNNQDELRAALGLSQNQHHQGESRRKEELQQIRKAQSARKSGIQLSAERHKEESKTVAMRNTAHKGIVQAEGKKANTFQPSSANVVSHLSSQFPSFQREAGAQQMHQHHASHVGVSGGQMSGAITTGLSDANRHQSAQKILRPKQSLNPAAAQMNASPRGEAQQRLGGSIQRRLDLYPTAPGLPSGGLPKQGQSLKNVLVAPPHTQHNSNSQVRSGAEALSAQVLHMLHQSRETGGAGPSQKRQRGNLLPGGGLPQNSGHMESAESSAQSSRTAHDVYLKQAIKKKSALLNGSSAVGGVGQQVKERGLLSGQAVSKSSRTTVSGKSTPYEQKLASYHQGSRVQNSQSIVQELYGSSQKSQGPTAPTTFHDFRPKTSIGTHQISESSRSQQMVLDREVSGLSPEPRAEIILSKNQVQRATRARVQGQSQIISVPQSSDSLSQNLQKLKLSQIIQQSANTSHQKDLAKKVVKSQRIMQQSKNQKKLVQNWVYTPDHQQHNPSHAQVLQVSEHSVASDLQKSQSKAVTYRQIGASSSNHRQVAKTMTPALLPSQNPMASEGEVSDHHARSFFTSETTQQQLAGVHSSKSQREPPGDQKTAAMHVFGQVLPSFNNVMMLQVTGQEDDSSQSQRLLPHESVVSSQPPQVSHVKSVQMPSSYNKSQSILQAEHSHQKILGPLLPTSQHSSGQKSNNTVVHQASTGPTSLSLIKNLQDHNAYANNAEDYFKKTGAKTKGTKTPADKTSKTLKSQLAGSQAAASNGPLSLKKSLVKNASPQLPKTSHHLTKATKTEADQQQLLETLSANTAIGQRFSSAQTFTSQQSVSTTGVGGQAPKSLNQASQQMTRSRLTQFVLQSKNSSQTSQSTNQSKKQQASAARGHGQGVDGTRQDKLSQSELLRRKNQAKIASQVQPSATAAKQSQNMQMQQHLLQQKGLMQKGQHKSVTDKRATEGGLNTMVRPRGVESPLPQAIHLQQSRQGPSGNASRSPMKRTGVISTREIKSQANSTEQIGKAPQRQLKSGRKTQASVVKGAVSQLAQQQVSQQDQYQEFLRENSTAMPGFDSSKRSTDLARARGTRTNLSRIEASSHELIGTVPPQTSEARSQTTVLQVSASTNNEMNRQSHEVLSGSSKKIQKTQQSSASSRFGASQPSRPVSDFERSNHAVSSTNKNALLLRSNKSAPPLSATATSPDILHTQQLPFSSRDYFSSSSPFEINEAMPQRLNMANMLEKVDKKLNKAEMLQSSQLSTGTGTASHGSCSRQASAAGPVQAMSHLVTFDAHQNSVIGLQANFMARTSTSPQFASFAKDNTVKLWSVSTQKPTELISNNRAAAMNLPPKVVLKRQVKNNARPSQKISSFCFMAAQALSTQSQLQQYTSEVSLQKSILVTGCSDKTLRLYAMDIPEAPDSYDRVDFPARSRLRGSQNPSTADVMQPTLKLTGQHGGPITQIVQMATGNSASVAALSSDGTSSSYADDLFLTGCTDGAIRMYSLSGLLNEETDQALCRFDQGSTGVKQITPMGENTFLSAGFDSAVRLWDIRAQDCQHQKLLKDPNFGQLTWLQKYNQNIFASACNDGLVNFWDVRKMQLVKQVEMPAHAGIAAIQFAKKRQLMIVAHDHKVSVINISSENSQSNSQPQPPTSQQSSSTQQTARSQQHQSFSVTVLGEQPAGQYSKVGGRGGQHALATENAWGNGSKITSMVYSEADKKVYAGGFNKKISVWNLNFEAFQN